MVKIGIKVDETLKNYYSSVHLGKLKGFKFTIEGSRCIVDERSILQKDHETPFQTLVLNDLDNAETCFIAVNISFRNTEGRHINKTMLFIWCGDEATIRQKMVLASSVAGIKTSLAVQEGCCVEIHGRDEQCVNSVFDKIIGKRAKPAVFETRPITYNPDNRIYSFADV